MAEKNESRSNVFKGIDEAAAGIKKAREAMGYDNTDDAEKFNQKVDAGGEAFKNFIAKVGDAADGVIKEVEKQDYINRCSDVQKMDDCVEYIMKERIKYPAIAAVIIVVEKNPEAYLENHFDELKIITGALDSEHKPVYFDKERAVSRVTYARAMDNKLLHFLNGKKSVIIDF